MKAPPSSVHYLQCRIPNELMYLIFDLLEDSPPALCKLLMLHRLFHPTLERMLYSKHIRFEDRESHIGYLTTLANNPRLAAHITAYDLQPTVKFGGWQNEDIDKVAPAVLNMVNLKHLHVDMWMYNPFDPEELFEALKGKRLESFEWSTWCRKEEVTEFLRTQPDIVRLKTQFIDAPQTSLEETCCRRLWYLNGDRAVMEVMMPARNVEVLVWTPLMFERLTALSGALQPAINRLRALAYDGKRTNTVPMHLINGLATRLEVLQVTYFHVSKRVFLEAIGRMSKLRTLIVISSSEEHEKNLRRERVLFLIATACPSLVSVYISAAIAPATPIPPEHPNEHWRVKRDAEAVVPLVKALDLVGVEKGDIFHRIVDEWYQIKTQPRLQRGPRRGNTET